MRKPLTPESRTIVSEELSMLERVISAVERRAGLPAGASTRVDYDADLVALRDQIADEKPEDHASLVEAMTRIASLASSVKKRTSLPIDAMSPYFAHMRLRIPDRARRSEGQTGKERMQDVLIGRRGLIDREAGVQIVDWRDAPVSQVYYRYDEGED